MIVYTTENMQPTSSKSPKSGSQHGDATNANQPLSPSSQEPGLARTPKSKTALLAQATADESSKPYQHSPTEQPDYRISPSGPNNDQRYSADISTSPLQSAPHDLGQSIQGEPSSNRSTQKAPVGNETAEAGARNAPQDHTEAAPGGHGVRYRDSPGERGTDPEFWRQNIPAAQHIMGIGDGRDESPLHPSYKLRSHGFFCAGRVFKLLWAEPAGATTKSVTGIIPGLHGQMIYSKVRYFVVIRPAHDYCSALSISSYGGRGVAKVGVKKSEHGIIHTGKSCPNILEAEQAGHGESGMRTDAIRVVNDDPTDALDPMSRIDYGKVFTIQHNLKVKNLGEVHHRSRNALMAQFWNVWSSNIRNATNKTSSSGVDAGTSASAIRSQPMSDGITSFPPMQIVNPVSYRGSQHAVTATAAYHFQRQYGTMLQRQIPDYVAFQACVKQIMDANADMSRYDAEGYIQGCLAFRNAP